MKKSRPPSHSSADCGFDDLGFAKVDLDRQQRCGLAECLYGEGKSPAQLVAIARSLKARNQPVLVTRLKPDGASRLRRLLPGGHYSPEARLFTWRPEGVGPDKIRGTVAVCAAGTCDGPVAEEAALVLEFYGVTVRRIYDVGVAGLHRLLAQRDVLENVSVIIAVAGMEGALPSVITGLVSCPVIGVPVSVGYGVNYGGINAMHSMLGSCASGLVVVNVDNGFGAACAAYRILRRRVS